MESENKTMNVKKLSISLKSFIVSMAIIIALMIVAYVLTFVLPAGNYLRVKDANGNMIIYTDADNPYGIYSQVTRDFPFWKFILSPFLVLGSEGNITLIAICIFLLIIGGVFNALSEQNLIEYLLKKIVKKTYKKRYLLLVILPLVFMLLSSFAGCFEEIIPLVPVVVALAIALGWNNMVGITFSILACSCGYAAGVLNPFGTGIAQQVAGIPAFSGIWMRIVVFVVLYLILVAFLFIYCKHYEKKHPASNGNVDFEFEPNPKQDKAIYWLGGIIGFGILFIVSSIFIKALQDYTLIGFALCFFIAGVVGCFVSGMKIKPFLKAFGKGALTIAPSILMILCATSVKYILTESNTLDTLIKYIMDASKGMSKYALILFIFVIVLLFELFVPSGSAKAFLLIPLILPVCTVMGIPGNVVILAYIFGDGLANALYPTNPGLLIALNLADTNYGKYFKFVWKIALILLVVLAGLLMFAVAVNYN